MSRAKHANNIMEVIDMKKTAILAAANAKVAEYMTEGYMLSWGDSSFGCEFRVDLEKNDHHVRVQVKSFSDWSLDHYVEGLALTVVEIECADAFERKDCGPVFVQNFYRVGGRGYRDDDSAWYVDSEDEALAISEKRFKRGMTRHVKTERVLTPSAALIRGLKKRKGFTNATRTTIQVTRTTEGYRVALKNRAGKVTHTESFKLGK